MLGLLNKSSKEDLTNTGIHALIEDVVDTSLRPQQQHPCC
jgi:hypothetical protein